MLTVFSRNRERICWYVVNGSRALEVPAVYGRIFYIIPVSGQPTMKGAVLFLLRGNKRYFGDNAK